MTVAHLTEREIHALFDAFDSDHSASLCASELSSLFYSLGWNSITVEHCQMLMREHFGKNDDNSYITCGGEKVGITYDEFLVLLNKVQIPHNSATECYQAFYHFDRGQKGFVSPEDLKYVGRLATSRYISDQLIAELMKSIDVIDNDGKISWDEFKQACTHGGLGTESGQVAIPEESMVREGSSPHSERKRDRVKPAAREMSPKDEELIGEFGLTKAEIAMYEARVNEVGDYFNEVVGKAEVRVHTRSNSIAKEDVRRALCIDYGYSDLRKDDNWDLMWNQFLAENKDPSLRYITPDRRSLTISGFKHLLRGLGELE